MWMLSALNCLLFQPPLKLWFACLPEPLLILDQLGSPLADCAAFDAEAPEDMLLRKVLYLAHSSGALDKLFDREIGLSWHERLRIILSHAQGWMWCM